MELTAEGYANIVPACATPVELPYRDSTFDCVALDDVCAQALALTHGLAFRAIQDQLFQECRRVLRKGGCLSIGISNTHWWGRARNRRARCSTGEPPPHAVGAPLPRTRRRSPGERAVSLHGLKHRLTGAGFARVRIYCAEPSHDQPRCIIPMDRGAVLAYEGFGRPSSPHGRLRRLLARLGLRRVLYPSLIYLAYV
jgi:SAM-dependent methyltransferase